MTFLVLPLASGYADKIKLTPCAGGNFIGVDVHVAKTGDFMPSLFEKDNLPKWKQEETLDLNSPIFFKKDNYFCIFKKYQYTSSVPKLKRRSFSTFYFETNSTLEPKPNKDITRK